MDSKQVVESFAALANEVRLGIIQSLIKAGSAGVNAGRLAEQFDVAPSKLSFHLNALSQAGLISSERQSRQIFYRVKFDRMAALAQFMLKECCSQETAFDRKDA